MEELLKKRFMELTGSQRTHTGGALRPFEWKNETSADLEESRVGVPIGDMSIESVGSWVRGEGCIGRGVRGKRVDLNDIKELRWAMDGHDSMGCVADESID